MKKIKSLYQRNYDGDRLVRDEVVPGSEWVLNGEGVATRKWDGTSVMVRDEGGKSSLWKRYDLKAGKPAPDGFVPAQEPDEVTGAVTGWVPCRRGDPADRWHFEGYDAGPAPYSGTYELVGPKVQGNPDGFDAHRLVKHGDTPIPDFPRDFEGIKSYLESHDIEGVVWHHPDGRMVKIKGKDFGIKRRQLAKV